MQNVIDSSSFSIVENTIQRFIDECRLHGTVFNFLVSVQQISYLLASIFLISIKTFLI